MPLGGKGTLAWAPDGSAAVAVTLPRAPEGKTYEAWVMRKGSASPAGLFSGSLRLPDRPPGPARLRRRRHARAGRGRRRADRYAARHDRRGVVTVLTTQPPTKRPSRDLARLSDEALLSLVASSDEDALAALYDRFGRVAYGLALRILRDQALAQDAVQEAFLGVWRNADRFLAERAKASTWILTLVHRRAVDLVRREDIRRGEPLERAPEPTEPKTAEDEASLGFQRRVVQEALSQLPPEQREAIELGYYGGLTQSELAERLDQPLGTIKSRMFTGLSRLRDLLDQAGLEGSYP